MLKNEKVYMIKVGKHLISLIVLAVLFFLGLGSSESESSGADKFGAFYICKEFVEDRLKSPSSAKFSSFSESVITDAGGGRFRVTGYVDAENSFGAMLRKGYICVVESSNGDTWVLESLEFLNRMQLR